MTGADPNYPSLADAQAQEEHLFGPNCTHDLAAYIPPEAA